MNASTRIPFGVGTAIMIIAAIVLPTQAFLILAWFLAIIGALVLTGFWHERSQHYYSEYVWASSDAKALALDLERTNARLAEVLDENQLLRDDALDAPVPYAIVHEISEGLPKPLRLVIPNQRDAGDAS